MIGRRGFVASVGAIPLLASTRVRAATQPVRIGVLGDQTSVGSAASGRGTVTAVRMAIDAFGSIGDQPVEMVSADFQLKPDIAVSIARDWFDQGGVCAIVDMPVSSAALAVQSLARSKQRTMLLTTAVTADLTGSGCSPYSSHWADDSYCLTHAAVRGLEADGRSRSWFLIVPNYALGAALQRDAAAAIAETGGRVVGVARHPVETSDFSSYLLAAQASGADMIGIGSVGDNLINTVKQAREFGIMAGSQAVVLFLTYITDIHSLGLPAAQGLKVIEGFYWNQSDPARAFANRFKAATGGMPSKAHAASYAAVTHFLQAVRTENTTNAAAVNKRMRATPVDFFGRRGSIRSDGRVLFDISVYRVKTPDESQEAWDYYALESTVPAAAAYRPLADSGCNA